MDKPLRDMIISGISTQNGGTFRLAKIEGVGKVNTDVTCSDFKVDGIGKVLGNLEAKSAIINGIMNFDGSVHADRLVLNGRLTIGGDLTGEKIEIYGTTKVEGRCETERFKLFGKLQAAELNAGHVNITLQGSSQVDEIGGENIQVRKHPGRWLILPIPFSNRLTAKTIEGDDIYIEHTTADVVRGANIRIGPGCEIGLVEYKSEFNQDAGSKVKSLQQI